MNNHFDEYSEDQLKESFDFIEKFINDNVTSWDVAPNTSNIEAKFSKKLSELDDQNLGLLLLHSGYIPELYQPDSSQETLYSKLIESLVCEWARRIGFTESFLQTQKSNKEDVTIKKENKIIVCDAKSFRLGRSQAAPNVKDTIKKSAYTTWLEQYNQEDKVGGLVTFPSLHDWKTESEAYSYFTEGNPPIMLLFYEHLAFMLLNSIKSDTIINFLNSYDDIFPKADKNRDTYWTTITQEIFSKYSEYNDFMNESSIIIKKKVNHVLNQISQHLSEVKDVVESELEGLSTEDIKDIAVNAVYENRCNKIISQNKNIIKFRPHD